MARIEKYKGVNIPPSVHKRVMKLIEGTDLSATKMVDLLLRYSLKHVEENGLKMAMSKNKDGKAILNIV